MKTKVNTFFFGNSIMDTDTQFPGVVHLDVNGFEYRALLSTLTKHENSLLAAMFTGQRPVYKDKDGRYFLEANGSSFHAILHYLRYDEISFTAIPNYSSRLFGSGGFHSRGSSDADFKAIYADAVNLGLSSLVQELEQYQAILADRKMKEYRKSVNCYEKVLNKILSGIPSDVFFYETIYTIRLDQDFQTTTQDKCCEHDCKSAAVNVFTRPQTLSVDETVKVPCEITLTLLSSFVKDLQQIGYCVNGHVTTCGFCCQKDVKQSRLFSFSNQMKNCCGERMLLLMFKFGSDPVDMSYPTFGQKQTGFGQPNTTGFNFGQPNVQKGQGLFGGSIQNKSAFGNTPELKSGSDFFGHGQSSSNTYDFGSQQSQGFGSKQPHGFGFSSQQSQGFGVGSQQSQGFGSKQPQGFGFGSQKSQEFSSQQSQGFGSQQSQGFGSQQPQGFSFGSQKPQDFGAGHQQQQGCSFGSQQTQGFGFGSQEKQRLTFSGGSAAGPQQSKDAPAGFGLSGLENKPASGFGSFGTANVVGNVKTTSSGSFGKPASTLPTPRLGTTSADVQKQCSTPSGLQSSSQPDSTKLPAFNFAGVVLGPTTTSSGGSGIFSTPTAQTAGGFLFNSNQQASPNKKPSQVFGSSASFSSPIKVSTLGSLFDGVKLENALPVPVDVDRPEDSKQGADKKEDSPTVSDNVNDM